MIKRTLVGLLVIIAGCLTLVIIINLFDAPETQPLFTEEDLNTVSSTGSDNGFYWLLSFNEPKGVDVTSEEIVSLYSTILADGEPGINAQEKISKRISENVQNWDFTGPHFNTKDPFEAVKNHTAVILADIEQFKPMIERLERAVNAERVEDFTPLSFVSPVPTFVTLNNTTDLYIKLLVIEGLRDGWDTVADRFLGLLDFWHKMLSSSRPLINRVVAQTLFEKTLDAWNQVLSKTGNTPDLYITTIQRLEKYRLSGFSSKNSMVYEYIMIIDAMKRGLAKFEEAAVLTAGFSPRLFLLNRDFLFKKNLTIEYFSQYYSQVIQTQEELPYKAKRLKIPSKRDSFFWWVRNCGGKLFFEVAVFDFSRYINKSYTAHALNEMSLLAATLHQDKVVEHEIPDWLKKKAQEGFIDPFSGTPYQWDAQEKSLKLILNETFKLNKPGITVPVGNGV
jgi:hypothetical protein